ncbi:MAG: YdeI/OmpD-associated family protein [Chitinophagaceae bacterium]|nr:YdeI/OmpD-associated family protein [Chitinophagaceae bacterium]
MQKKQATNVLDIDNFYPVNRKKWRQWLEKHHDVRQSVWLLYYKKNSGKPTITYSDAVDEALCFGWIDSRAKGIDEDCFIQFFSRRKSTSVWSMVNKRKVDMLIEKGLMTKAGLERIETAKQNGSYYILDDVEALVVPADLEKAFEEKEKGWNYFENLSRSDKRNMLQWLKLAKRQETRQKRIDEIVTLAVKQQKPKQFTQPLSKRNG